MKHIAILAQHIKPSKIKRINILGKEQRADELHQILYRNSAATIDQTREEIGLDPSAFSLLMNRSFDAFVNTALAMRTDNSLDKRLSIYRSLKKTEALVEIMIFEHSIAKAIPIAEQTIKKAMKYEFNDVAASLSYWIYYYYSVLDTNRDLYNRYKKIHFQCKAKLEAEQQMQHLYCEFCMEFNISNMVRMERIAKEVRIILGSRESYRTYYIGYNLLAVYYITAGRYNDVIETCQKALDYFNSTTRKSNSPLFSFNFRMLPIYIITGDLFRAVECLKECLSLFDEGTNNYYLAKRYAMVIALHQGDFDLAFRLSESGDTEKMVGRTKEYWKLITAYACLMTDQRLKLGKLMNELPFIQSDKTAYNVNIYMLEMLHYLAAGKPEQIIDRLAALESYTRRYLNSANNIRPRTILNAVIDLARNNFNSFDVQKYARKLDKNPIDQTGQDVDLEIVPYEMLLDFIDQQVNSK